MRTLVQLAAMAVIALVGVSGPSASAEPQKTSARMQMMFCQIASAELSESVGECMQRLRGIRGVAATCRALHEQDQLWLVEAIFEEEANNRGRCTRILRKYL